MDFRERKKRPFEDLMDMSEIMQMLQDHYTKGKKLHLKYDITDSDVGINEIMGEDEIMLLTPENYEPKSEIIVVGGLLDKYVEFDLQIIQKRGPGYFQCKVKTGRKASTGRRDLRFKMETDTVVATNFKISKHTIDVTHLNVPTSIKVILEQFQSQYFKGGDLCKVETFEKTDVILEAIKKTSKSLFVEDLSKVESYAPLTDDFLDLQEVLGKEEFNRYRVKSVERGYKSIIISPIIYVTEAEQSVPFGYILIISKDQHYTLEKVLEVKDHSFRLVDRIRDANTVILPVRQDVMDISRGGARLRITDNSLKLSMLKARGFVFDLVFKLQAPITIYGETKFTGKDTEGNLILGISFAGNSSRKDEMKRLNELIKPMELEYKKRLLKQMQTR